MCIHYYALPECVCTTGLTTKSEYECGTVADDVNCAVADDVYCEVLASV